MSGITRRDSKLSDGRDFIYFDDPDTSLPQERASDTREAIARPDTAIMRQDILTGEWVSIAAARQNRVHLPPVELDPLAPATETNLSEAPSNYDVAVFENKSPSFGPLLEDDNAPANLEELTEVGLNRTRTSVGRCEVVCFSPDSVGSFSHLSRTRARTVIEAWAQRTQDLSAMRGVEQVFPFENRGEEIGVTLHHPHGQIYSYPYITPQTKKLITSIDKYGPNMFNDILENEQASDRVLLRGQHWTAFVPFAARWPLEIHMLPHRQIPDMAATNDEERDELSELYLRLLRGVDSIYTTRTPYIAAWHQAPVHSYRDDIRLMLQIISPRRAEDKLKYLAGSEAAMGAWIGDMPPEVSAQLVRDGIARADADWPVEKLHEEARA